MLSGLCIDRHGTRSSRGREKPPILLPDGEKYEGYV
jgi:hypothetical protein